MRLYHSTRDYDTAFTIEDNGFKGSKVWDYENAVFLADRQLEGFGQEDAFVAVDVPEDMLEQGYYPEADAWDNEQYEAQCYCFNAEIINQLPRFTVDATGERVE